MSCGGEKNHLWVKTAWDHHGGPIPFANDGLDVDMWCHPSNLLGHFWKGFHLLQKMIGGWEGLFSSSWLWSWLHMMVKWWQPLWVHEVSEPGKRASPLRLVEQMVENLDLWWCCEPQRWGKSISGHLVMWSYKSVWPFLSQNFLFHEPRAFLTDKSCFRPYLTCQLSHRDLLCSLVEIRLPLLFWTFLWWHSSQFVLMFCASVKTHLPLLVCEPHEDKEPVLSCLSTVPSD